MYDTKRLTDAAAEIGHIRYHMHKLRDLLLEARAEIDLLDEVTLVVFEQHIQGRSPAGESADLAQTQGIALDQLDL